MSFPSHTRTKDSGIPWLGNVPEHWSVKRLRHIATLNPSKSEISHLSSDTELSFLPMEAVGDDGRLSLDRTRPISDVETGYTYFREGDVTIAKITPCFENGKGAIMRGLLGGAGFGSTELIVARPDKSKVSSEYLHALFTSLPFRKLGEATMYGAGGQKRVPDDFVRDFKLAIPPLDEQVQVVAFLDRETAKIDDLLSEQEKLVALLGEKRQAVILQAMTKGLNQSVPLKESGIEWIGLTPTHWDVLAIKRLSSVKRGASPRPIDDSKYFDDGGDYAWVRIADVSSSDGFLRDTTQTLSELGSSLSVKLAPGQLFVSIAGTVGKPCITEIKACIHDGFVYFPDLKINPMYLFRIFEAGICYGGLGKMGTQLNLNTETIGSIKVSLPPPNEVTQILEYIDQETKRFDALTQEALRVVALLRERRSAIVSAAVTGKIDVRGFVGPSN